MSHEARRVRSVNSLPMRRLGRLASVVPASPTNRSSESKSRMKTESVALLPLEGSVRRPTSAPLERTRKGVVWSGLQGHGIDAW